MTINLINPKICLLQIGFLSLLDSLNQNVIKFRGLNYLILLILFLQKVVALIKDLLHDEATAKPSKKKQAKLKNKPIEEKTLPEPLGRSAIVLLQILKIAAFILSLSLISIFLHPYLHVETFLAVHFNKFIHLKNFNWPESLYFQIKQHDVSSIEQLKFNNLTCQRCEMIYNLHEVASLAPATSINTSSNANLAKYRHDNKYALACLLINHCNLQNFKFTTFYQELIPSDSFYQIVLHEKLGYQFLSKNIPLEANKSDHNETEVKKSIIDNEMAALNHFSNAEYFDEFHHLDAKKRQNLKSPNDMSRNFQQNYEYQYQTILTRFESCIILFKHLLVRPEISDNNRKMIQHCQPNCIRS